MKVTKKDLSIALSHETGETQANCYNTVDALFKVMASQISQGKGIEIRGFGSFSLIVHKAKKARDIGRNIEIMLPERKGVKFRLSKSIEIK